MGMSVSVDSAQKAASLLAEQRSQQRRGSPAQDQVRRRGTLSRHGSKQGVAKAQTI